MMASHPQPPPACGNPETHDPHDFYRARLMSNDRSLVECAGVKGPKPGSLDALLKAAYDAGYERAQVQALKDRFPEGGPWNQGKSFEQWRESLA